MISSTPKGPAWATAYPKRRKRMAPRIVLMAARKTGDVPNPCPRSFVLGVKYDPYNAVVLIK
jgi:hypothetical protein